MAKVQPLKLSDLKPGLEYPIGNWIPDGRCLIHVKLTELCMKSVEGLMNSDKVGGHGVSVPQLFLELRGDCSEYI